LDRFLQIGFGRGARRNARHRRDRDNRTSRRLRRDIGRLPDDFPSKESQTDTDKEKSSCSIHLRVRCAPEPIWIQEFAIASALWALAKAAALRPFPTHRADTAKMSILPADRFGEAGAGDETRTRDVLLGKEVLYP